jgi:hypothetical protein
VSHLLKRLSTFSCESTVDAGIFQATAHLIENVEMVLDVLNRNIVWQPVQQRFNILFSVAHRSPFGKNITLAVWLFPQSDACLFSSQTSVSRITDSHTTMGDNEESR